MIPNIDDRIHLIWTDALLAEFLANQVSDKFNRGSFVRWSIISAWTTLEISCSDAIGVEKLEMDFKNSIDHALKDKNIQKIEWGSGIWQEILKIKKKRIDAVHNISENIEYPNSSIASDFISTVREAIKDIYRICDKSQPLWIDDVYDYTSTILTGKSSVSANLTGVHANAENDPERITIKFLMGDKEAISSISPRDFDYLSEVDRLKKTFTIPVDQIDVYRGEKLIHTELLNMRGGGL